MITNVLTNDEIEKTKLAFATAGTIKGAARMLGIAHRTMQHRMKYIREGNSRFYVPKLPSKDRTIDELIKDKIDEAKRSKEAAGARELIQIKVNIDGPFALLIFGDPHVDDPGCDFELLAKHRQIAIDHPFCLASSIGDYSNNWVGRLGRLYADQQITASESWKLVEWLISEIKWLFLVGGNHDLWSGSSDPIQWMVRQAESMYEPHGVRLALKHPCGNFTRIHARHDFSGHSIYHSLHGPKREAIMGFRDHLIVAGHKHIGGSEQMVTPDGLVSQIVRVSGYKTISDSYAHQLGLKKMPLHPSAFIIIDPREPETSGARCWCAPNVETGVKILDAIRADYEASNAAKRQHNSSVDKKRVTRKGSR